MTDTSQTIEIKKSIKMSIVLTLAGVIGIISCIWYINGGAYEKVGESGIYFGWIGSFVSGIFTLHSFWKLLFGDSIPVVISPKGLHCRDMWLEEIPWTDFSEVSEVPARVTSSIRVELTPNAGKVLRSNLKWKIARKLYKATGRKAFIIPSLHLDMSCENFVYIVISYFEAHNPDI